jgi:biopolymer transport protein ExbB
MGERITINALAGGIYQAMITTAAGLVVAIPYYLIYNHLVTRVGTLTRLTEEYAEEFVDLLTEASTAKEPTCHAL